MLPWPDMLRWALQAGLAPDQFWALSVKEWHWLTRSPSARLSHLSFQSLMEQYPDG